MNVIETYIREVLRNITAVPAERQRIEADLRAHIQEALDAGETPQAVLARMGSPLDVAAEFMSQVPLQYASFWRRVAAYLVDMFIFVLTAAALAIPAVILANQVPQHPEGRDYVIGAILIAVTIGLALAAVGCILLYFPILEGRYGRTVGKKLFGLRVLKENGLPTGYKEAFLRRLSFYFEFIVLDAVFILFTAQKQRAFDIVARTVVIWETH